MFDGPVEPRRCGRCGARPWGHEVEHARRIHGFRVPIGYTLHFQCIECGNRFFIESPSRTVMMALAAVADLAVSVLLVRLFGGLEAVWEDLWNANDLFDLYAHALILGATVLGTYLTTRVVLSELHRRRNPRR